MSAALITDQVAVAERARVITTAAIGGVPRIVSYLAALSTIARVGSLLQVREHMWYQYRRYTCMSFLSSERTSTNEFFCLVDTCACSYMRCFAGFN